MYKHLITLLSILILLVACKHQLPVVKPVFKKLVIAKPFDKIAIEANMDLMIYGGAKNSKIILRGYKDDLAKLELKVINKKLILVMPKLKNYLGAIKAEIYLKNLAGFTFNGIGIVIGKNITGNLAYLNIVNNGKFALKGHFHINDLNVKGTGFVDLQGLSSNHLKLSIESSRLKISGFVNVSRIHLSKQASLELYWLKAKKLYIDLKDEAYLEIAGTVDRLYGNFCDNAVFKGKYLRANSAFIKTHQQAIAEINTLKHQHSVAFDASDIYFYNLPKTKTSFMGQNGSVLDLRNLDEYNVEEYTIYNNNQ